MSTSAEDVAAVVEALIPFDEVEAGHREDALDWLRSTDDIFRRVPPSTPPKHLVAYFLLHDPVDCSVLLVHHRKARLWLPTGGHVEPGEDPRATVEREAIEELGVPAFFTDPGRRPLFVTVTETNEAPEVRHTDVSLWFLLTGASDDDLRPDDHEFVEARWWTRSEIATFDSSLLEPHLGRFLDKVDANRAGPWR